MIFTKSKTYTFLNIFPLILILTTLLFIGCGQSSSGLVVPQKGDHIILVGNNLGSRMMNYGHFETDVQLKFSDSLLIIRNLCDGGNTAGFRPHPGIPIPWSFPGAEFFQTEFSANTGSQGHFETPDQWITRLEGDIIIGFFGFSESFSGQAGLENFKNELQAFIDHTLSQKYNGSSSPQLVLVSPTAFEDLSDHIDVPNGIRENIDLKLYMEAMAELALKNSIPFVDVYTITKKWYDSPGTDLTIDGVQMNDDGYAKFSKYLSDQIFGRNKIDQSKQEMVHEAVQEKNWMWHNDYKIPNGVHVYGRRYNPFGPDNYPAEIEKIRQMTSLRDSAIWLALKGEELDLASADELTRELPEVETNYVPSRKNGDTEYLYGEDAVLKLNTPPGYKVELFASEREFPDLANPVQLSFDNKGRLWVATMPSYPHYKPGDSKPDDKLIILEDRDNDGRADNQIVFAGGLHLPLGFELAPEGVYVSQGTNLVLLRDLDGDDHADTKEVILSGFDDHDTHHAISAFCADPSGAIYMGEGVFLHSNVETAYGTIRGSNGGFFRYAPQRRHLERTSQVWIPNPWGIAFDEWGQNFFAETSGPAVRWMLPGSVKPRYGQGNYKGKDLIKQENKVRPTSGLEFVHSRHFPDEVQGDMLINNSIGFLGMKQHIMLDDSAGFKTELRHDLVQGDDKNFRPVDMEFAPDGSLYFVDWHNILIGHMQHNARDPYRDHVHGRVYRITYPARPLVTPAKIDGASIEELFTNLELPEYRTRYRTKRELRGRDSDKVLSGLQSWIEGLDKSSDRYEHHLLEGLWVSWGLNKVDKDLLEKLLKANDPRARAAAVRVLRYTGHQIDNQSDLLMGAARDENERVRLEVVAAASWLHKDYGVPILEEVAKKPWSNWLKFTHEKALAHINDRKVEPKEPVVVVSELEGIEHERYVAGKEIFERDGFCSTCHQKNGKGLVSSGFPPLNETKWVLGSEERLIKIVLNGLLGPIEVQDVKYGGQVPMTPYAGMLNDEEIASVLTYVRNSFGNKATAISPEKVKEVRESSKDKVGFYSPAELLEAHPHE